MDVDAPAHGGPGGDRAAAGYPGQQDFNTALESEGLTPVETPTATTVPELTPAPATPVAEVPVPAATATVAAPKAPTDSAGTVVVASMTVKTAPAKAAALVAAPTPAPAVPAKVKVAAAPAAPQSATTIKTRTGRFYVIAGAYSSLKRAEEGRRTVAQVGARIIVPPPGSRLFRLAVADYSDLASAQREAQRLRVSTHRDYNTLKF